MRNKLRIDIDIATARRLAVIADVDPRTIVGEALAAYGKREHVRGMAGHRARKVLRAEGLIPDEGATPR